MTHDPNFGIEPEVADDLKKWSGERWGEPSPTELLARLSPQLHALSPAEPLSVLESMPEPPAAPVPLDAPKVLVSSEQRKWRLALVAGLVITVGLIGLILVLSINQSSSQSSQQVDVLLAAPTSTSKPTLTVGLPTATSPTPTLPTTTPASSESALTLQMRRFNLNYPTGQILSVDVKHGWDYQGLPESKSSVTVVKGALGTTDIPEFISQYYHTNLRQAGYEVADTGGLEIDCFSGINTTPPNCAAAGARTLQARQEDIIISVRIYGSVYRQRLNGSVFAALNAQLTKDQTLIIYTVLQNQAFKSTTPLPTIPFADGLTPQAPPTATPIMTSAKQIEASAVANLKTRPLILPRVGIGAACPVTTGAHEVSPNYGLAIGKGPVYYVGSDEGVVDFGHSPKKEGWYPQKTLWVRSPDYKDVAIVRGGEIGDSDRINFNGVGTDTLVIPGDEGYDTGGWMDVPSETYVPTVPGCYAFQIDGTNFSYIIVFQAK